MAEFLDGAVNGITVVLAIVAVVIVCLAGMGE